MSTLTPDYLNLDFTTIIERIKEQLADSDTFADYDYEGANFTILMELFAYVGELNVYLLNKIAQNVHIETADIYEAVNRNARQMGYEPKGPVSARGTLTVTVSGVTPGHTVRLPAFTQFESTETDDDENPIYYANTILYTDTPTGSTYRDSIYVRQGEVTSLTGYTGADLVDNELILPEDYAYDSNLDDDYPSLEVYVNDVQWSRVSDFYDDLSSLQDENNVYQFVYDRYERSKLVFSSSRNVPATDDTIELTVLKTLGADGAVAANTITGYPTNFIYDVDTGAYLDNDDLIITVTNGSATTGESDREDIDTIKENAKAEVHAQFRNITSDDYVSHLESRSDVDAANAWGEQDLVPSGATQEFNKVHVSVIPNVWGTGTIDTSTSAWTPFSTSGAVLEPTGYVQTYMNTLKTHLEPRKSLTVYEVYDLPELIYFSFEFGIRLKRLASLSNVTEDLKNKLDYWFRTTNHNFGEIIDPNDIIEYLLDTTQVETGDTYSYLHNGLRNLNIRDIEIHSQSTTNATKIYEPNTSGIYPYYVDSSATWTGENQLRRIQLGFNQFPVLSYDSIKVTEES